MVLNVAIITIDSQIFLVSNRFLNIYSIYWAPMGSMSDPKFSSLEFSSKKQLIFVKRKHQLSMNANIRKKAADTYPKLFHCLKEFVLRKLCSCSDTSLYQTLLLSSSVERRWTSQITYPAFQKTFSINNIVAVTATRLSLLMWWNNSRCSMGAIMCKFYVL